MGDILGSVSTNGAGVWVAGWHSRNNLFGAGTDDDLFFSRSLDDGATWSAAALLNSDATVDSRADTEVMIDGEPNGTWIAAWTGSSEVYYSRSTDNAQTWATPQRLHPPSPAEIDRRPAVATDGQETWIVVWESGNCCDHEHVLFSRSTDDGLTWSAPGFIQNNTDIYEPGPNYAMLATDGAGTWVVVWDFDGNLGGTIGLDFDLLYSRSTDNGETWTNPLPLNGDAATDGQTWDEYASVATDGDTWITVWNRQEDLGGGVFADLEIVFSHSTDGGATWTDPAAVNTNAAVDAVHDWRPVVETDGDGDWVVLWDSVIPPSTDSDILCARSTDGGANWTDPEPFNTTASGDAASDVAPKVATNRTGDWVAAWSTPVGSDGDIVSAQFVLFCDEYVADERYGRLLFAPQCTRDAWALPGNPGEDHVYESVELGFYRGASSRVYLSSESHAFAELVVDDAVHVTATPAVDPCPHPPPPEAPVCDSGLGPYAYRPGVPPFMYNVPIDQNLAPEPAKDITDRIPGGESRLVFDLIDTQREIYGNTPVYLVVDCGIWLDEDESGQTTINFVSHDVDVEALQSDLYIATGNLSDLRQDQGFDRSDCLGLFIDTTQAVDDRPDPGPGTGYYYLAQGTCSDPTYGDSSLTPDPRDELFASDPCP